MKFIKQASGELNKFNMTFNMSVRFCLSCDLLNAFYRFQSLFISTKNCIVVTDVVMA